MKSFIDSVIDRVLEQVAIEKAFAAYDVALREIDEFIKQQVEGVSDET